jgi:hypothetical protein
MSNFIPTAVYDLIDRAVASSVIELTASEVAETLRDAVNADVSEAFVANYIANQREAEKARQPRKHYASRQGRSMKAPLEARKYVETKKQKIMNERIALALKMYAQIKPNRDHGFTLAGKMFCLSEDARTLEHAGELAIHVASSSIVMLHKMPIKQLMRYAAELHGIARPNELSNCVRLARNLTRGK